jgi:hypothetical protein
MLKGKFLYRESDLKERVRKYAFNEEGDKGEELCSVLTRHDCA